MNWTGGTLQRTKNANKGVVQKQKAYFARARTHLQNGSKSPVAPFRPSYFQNDNNFELVGYPPSFGSGSVRHTGHSARRRREATDREPSPKDDFYGFDGYMETFHEDTSLELSHQADAATKPPRCKPKCESCQPPADYEDEK